MTTTKKLLAGAVAASLLSASAVPAFADIELGEGLTVTGFVDMSFVYTDVDGAPESDQVFGIDQVETDFLYTGSDGVSARVDVEYSQDETGATNTFIEEAYITKSFGESLSIKGGRFLSYSGWETEEPTGLYQYSGTGYGGLFYGGYQQGVSAYYDAGVVDVMFSLINDLADPVDNDTEGLAYEAGVAVTPTDALTFKVFAMGEDDTTIVNFWGSYAVGGLTLAFETSVHETTDDTEAAGSLFMANYAWDKFALTGRVHAYTVDDVSTATTVSTDYSAVTIAPSYALSDNLLIVTELRLDTMDAGGATSDSTAIAFEALYAF